MAASLPSSSKRGFSRLAFRRCQVSFCRLPSVHSILQPSKLRSKRGKSSCRRAEGGRKGEGGGRKGKREMIAQAVTA